MRDETERRRLSWACRRGMLELDVLLQHFLKHQYAELSDVERKLFAQLLEESDPVLHRYFNTGESPADPALGRLVAKIRGSMGLGADQ